MKVIFLYIPDAYVTDSYILIFFKKKKSKAKIINNQKFDLLHKPQYIPSEYFTS